MSEFNFQQGLRDLAQAAQLNAANEAAKNSAKLLEAQKQQAALEKQKLNIEQTRLQEDRGRYEAAQNKLGRHKAIRNAMAEMERILQSFTRDLAAGRFNQIIGGVSLISFLGALTRWQLQMVTVCKEELEDLSDIRFMGALQQSFVDLVSLHSVELSSPALEKAVRKLTDFANWAGAYHDQYKAIKKKASDEWRALQSANKTPEWNALSKVQSALVSNQATHQKTIEIDTAIGRLWAAIESDVRTLADAGLGVPEIEMVVGKTAHPDLRELKIGLSAIRSDLAGAERLLRQVEAAWHSDKALLERGIVELEQGQLSAAENTQAAISRLDWTDFDASLVTRSLQAQLDTLLSKINALEPGKEKEAVALAFSFIQTFHGSALIRAGLNKRKAELSTKIALKAETRRSYLIALTGLAVLILIGGGIVFADKYAAAKAEKMRRVAAAELAEKERVAAAELAEKERVAAAKEKVQREKEIAAGKVLLDGAGRSLLLIPSGSFEMGSPEHSDTSVHSVSVSAFFLGETEVTYGEWKSVFGWAKANGYAFLSLGDGVEDNHPVTNLSWYDTVKWCNAKSEKEGLTPCYKVLETVYRIGEMQSVNCDWNASGYRLPTEAEWEKAARGGLKGKRFPNGDSLEKKDANIEGSNTDDIDGSNTVEVGRYLANGYGLYDMAGNVGEWCWDWYAPYSGDVAPKGPAAGSFRVLRGGYWGNGASSARSAARNFSTPSFADNFIGFRLARGRLQSGEAGSR